MKYVAMEGRGGMVANSWRQIRNAIHLSVHGLDELAFSLIHTRAWI